MLFFNESTDPCVGIRTERDKALDKIARAAAVLAAEDTMTSRTVRKLKRLINEAQAILAE